MQYGFTSILVVCPFFLYKLSATLILLISGPEMRVRAYLRYASDLAISEV